MRELISSVSKLKNGVRVPYEARRQSEFRLGLRWEPVAVAAGCDAGYLKKTETDLNSAIEMVQRIRSDPAPAVAGERSEAGHGTDAAARVRIQDVETQDAVKHGVHKALLGASA